MLYGSEVIDDGTTTGSARAASGLDSAADDGRMGVFGAMDAWVSSAQAAMGLDILDSAAG
jgi:hypothetical protein